MNFKTHKKKNHLPALILKFLTPTPNLTSNFETQKNVGDNYFVKSIIHTCSKFTQSLKKTVGNFFVDRPSVRPSHPSGPITKHSRGLKKADYQLKI